MRAALLLGLFVASCAVSQLPTSSASPSPSPAVSSPLVTAIEYRRTGGIAGVDDRITVTREGLIEVHDRQGRHTSAQLSSGDLKELESLLAGWKKLVSPPREHATADAFNYSLSYDGVTVTAVEFSKVPEAFNLVRKRIEGMAERAR